MSSIIPDIAGNSQARDFILDWLRNKSAIAFVGAGASAELYGNWSALINHLITETVEAGFAKGGTAEFWRRYATIRPQQVARSIRCALRDDGHFHEMLKRFFEPRTHQESGTKYTPVHKEIAELPFKGTITTNYDGCLQAAIGDCRRDLTPEYCTWQDEDRIQDWYTGDIFDSPCYPILYAHGCWNRASTIILDNEMYRRAYRDGPYLRTFRHIWAAEHLVLIGVGFSDSWLDRTLDDILTYTVHAGAMRHVAILGLRAADLAHVEQLREMMQNAYNSRVLFYDVHQSNVDGRVVEDHSSLVSVLRELGAEVGKKEDVGSLEHIEEPSVLSEFQLKSQSYNPTTHLRRLPSAPPDRGCDDVHSK